MEKNNPNINLYNEQRPYPHGPLLGVYDGVSPGSGGSLDYDNDDNDDGSPKLVPGGNRDPEEQIEDMNNLNV